LIFKPAYTWPGVIIVMLGIPVYFFRKKVLNEQKKLSSCRASLPHPEYEKFLAVGFDTLLNRIALCLNGACRGITSSFQTTLSNSPVIILGNVTLGLTRFMSQRSEWQGIFSATNYFSMFFLYLTI